MYLSGNPQSVVKDCRSNLLGINFNHASMNLLHTVTEVLIVALLGWCLLKAQALNRMPGFGLAHSAVSSGVHHCMYTVLVRVHVVTLSSILA